MQRLHNRALKRPRQVVEYEESKNCLSLCVKYSLGVVRNNKVVFDEKRTRKK